MKNNAKKTLSCIFATHGFQNVFIFYIFFILLAEFVPAQVFELNNMPPPQIRLTYDKTPLNQSGFAVAEITIPETWHVNSHILVDDFLKPSQLKINAEGISFDSQEWPTPKKDYNEILEMENLIFEGTFYIKIPVRHTENLYDSTNSKVSFHYQACSKSICLAPDSVTTSTLSIFEHPFKQKSENKTSEKKINPTEKNATKKALEETLDTSSKEKFDLIIPEKITAETTISQTNESNEKEKTPLLLLLLFAFVGGLLLNFMPCVLPVLSLKLFSLVKQSQESRKRLTLLSLTTCLGILVSFWVLAAIVLIARMGGNNPGWGMQFQSPYFVGAMVALLTLFAMSFFGLFEIWLPSQTLTKMDGATKREGLSGAFFTGALLVLLSTPCSAPFLGSAMGFAFNAPNSILLLFFSAAGLGLSIPYLFVGFFPALLRIFPKPGKWMNTLQKIMGLLLLASVIWLIWVGFSGFGFSGLILFSTIAVINILLAFGIGKFAPPYRPFIREIFALSFTILINIGIALLGTTYLQQKEILPEDGWQTYSKETLKDARINGHIVFLDVTADWCITCKANEVAVLETEEMNQIFEQHNIKKIKADWTHADEEITNLLRSLGRSGVPAYAIYPTDTTIPPIVLPEILSTKEILNTIKTAQKTK